MLAVFRLRARAQVPRLHHGDEVTRIDAGVVARHACWRVLDGLLGVLGQPGKVHKDLTVDVLCAVHLPRLAVDALSVVDKDFIRQHALEADLGVVFVDVHYACPEDAGVDENLIGNDVDAFHIEQAVYELREVLGPLLELPVATRGQEHRAWSVARNLVCNRVRTLPDDVERYALFDALRNCARVGSSLQA